MYFPAGIYLIGDTLRLPNKVYMRGVAGTTYNQIDTDPGNFFDRVNTIIRLIGGSPDGTNMIVPKTPADFNSAGIENLILDGNKGDALGQGVDQGGVHLIDSASLQQRSQAQFRNLLIYRVKGVGFYAGVGQHELFLDWVTVFDCDSDGFVIRGEDIKGTRVASGKNRGVGIKFPGSGSTMVASGTGRFIDVDCWSNIIGMEISDTMGYVFFQLQLNLNDQAGLRLFSTTQSSAFSPGNVRIFRGRFSDNSHILDNGFPDIILEPNQSGYGPYDLALIGCEFHGSSGPNKPRYAVEDVSGIARRLLITGSFFIVENYYIGISNKPQAIRDCFDFKSGELLGEAELNYAWFDQNYSIGLGNGFIAIDAGSGERTVTLPPLSAAHPGRILYVCKTDGSTNSVLSSARGGESINGTGSLVLTGLRETYMIIHAGTGWLGVQIS